MYFETGDMPEKVEKFWSIWAVSDGVMRELIADSDIHLLIAEATTFFFGGHYFIVLLKWVAKVWTL